VFDGHGVNFETASRIFESFVFTVTDSRFDYGEVARSASTQSTIWPFSPSSIPIEMTARGSYPRDRQAAPKGNVMKTKYKKRTER